MKYSTRYKPREVSYILLLHQKDFCYQTHRGNPQLKINHVLKARNSFSHRNNVLKMAQFQNYFKGAHLPPVVHLQQKIVEDSTVL